jgi:hypothetical protein
MAPVAAAGAADGEGDDMRIKAGLAVGALLTLAVTACGSGGGGPKVASAATPGASGSPSASASPGKLDDHDSMLKYAQCMRANGVPNFPDPQFQAGGGVSIEAPDGVDPHTVDAANNVCKKFMPNGGEAQKVDPKVTEQLRKYAKCMRENGVVNFPDPGPNGGLEVQNDKLGMGPDDPKFKAALQTCAQYMPAGPGNGGQATLSSGNGA